MTVNVVFVQMDHPGHPEIEEFLDDQVSKDLEVITDGQGHPVVLALQVDQVKVVILVHLA